MPNQETHDLVVIGAGISGIHVAREASRAGFGTVLLDKGSRAGGRLATRPLDGHLADYGAQYFEFHSDSARSHLRQWQSEALSVPWALCFEGESPGLSLPKHMAVGGMNRLPASLASGLDLRVRTEVSAIESGESGWRISTRDGKDFAASSLVLSCPAPQAATLLNPVAGRLEAASVEDMGRIRYAPCFTLLVRLDQPSSIPCPGASAVDGESIAWISDNYQKGLSGDAHVLTIHASERFSTRYFDDDREVVTKRLLAALREYEEARVISWHLHRWRYARPKVWLSVPFLTMSSSPPMLLCGDAFGGDGVESALLSGLEAGREIVRMLAASPGKDPAPEDTAHDTTLAPRRSEA